MAKKSNPYEKAKPEQSHLKMLVTGDPKTGKSWTSLLLAQHLAEIEGGRVAALDTEGKSLSKYGANFDFDGATISLFSPATFAEYVDLAIQFEYKVLVVDSFTSFWRGNGGILSIADNAKMGWAVARPKHNEIIDKLLMSPIHIIGTTRIQDLLDSDFNRIGTRVSQDKAFKFEFDMVGEMQEDHSLLIEGSRCPYIPNNTLYKAGKEKEFVDNIYEWLRSGNPPSKWYEIKGNQARIVNYETKLRESGREFSVTIEEAFERAGDLARFANVEDYLTTVQTHLRGTADDAS